MNYGRRNSPSSPIAIAIVATLLGLLLALNAISAEQPVKTIDAIGAGLFLLTAGLTIYKMEDK